MRAREHLRSVLSQVVSEMGFELPANVSLEPPKDPKFGDLASNAAMMLAKPAKMNPRELAAKIAEAAKAADPHLANVDVAGPGFLNFVYAPSFWQETLAEVAESGAEYGRVTTGAGKKVQVEYVSANPTGPLHIGHGRGAALGDSLARILAFAGYDVQTEYYINDAGRQMRMLGTSIWIRYQQQAGRDVEFIEDGYQGDYIGELAAEIRQQRGDELLDMPEEDAIDACYEYGMTSILNGIKQDLTDFRVKHEVWFSEKSLVQAGKVQETIDRLKAEGLAYDKDGATWMETTRFGDDKDRVLKKSSGDLTYFASDIAYHADKYERGFDLVVDIWGADHHGYIPRMKAAVQALGRKPDDLEVILVQLVNLLRSGQQIAMSTRAGKFETLEDVVKEVGADSSRFIFLTRKSDSKLDFDLDLVKQQSMDNPVYYVQYAFARINSVKRKATEQDVTLPQGVPAPELAARLVEPEELALLKHLEKFPDTVEAAARNFSPHHISFYLHDLAGLMHRYYGAHRVLDIGDDQLTQARLALLNGVAQALANGLELLGVAAPDSM